MEFLDQCSAGNEEDRDIQFGLIKTASYQGQSEYSSIASLERDYSGAIIDVGLFRLMKDSTTRDEIRTLLKSTYLDNNSTPSSLIGVGALVAIICAVA